MGASADVLPVSLPHLRAMRWKSDTLYSGMKEVYAVARVEAGHTEWWAGGRTYVGEPGSIQVKQPGDIHRELSKDGPVVYQIVALPEHEVERVRGEGHAITYPQLDQHDERSTPFHRLHNAIAANADRLSLEVAVAEAVAALAALKGAPTTQTRPVRRAMEYLRTQLAEAVTLEDLAAYAGLDKFHLCRAFRAQIGMPPHAYLTHLRVRKAKALLESGLRASEVAPLVGLYDQSQLNRHFRKIVGTTPAVWGKRYGKTRPRASIVT